jgi:hypothetical protein
MLDKFQNKKTVNESIFMFKIQKFKVQKVNFKFKNYNPNKTELQNTGSSLIHSSSVEEGPDKCNKQL